MRGLLLLLLACHPPVDEARDTGDPSLYTTRGEVWRPQVHYTPSENWMNDPNGLVWLDGEWHLFYQHQPDLPIFGAISWGHAVTRDWTRFTELPVALAPDPLLGSAFSGSAVLDESDTSGLCAGGSCPVAVFTHHGGEGGDEKQSLAVSHDAGRTWTPYAGNPVLQTAVHSDFRDPKVWWDEGTRRWLMILAAGDRALLYASPDLIDWVPLSQIGPLPGVDGVWETPDLFELPVEGDAQDARWVLVFSTNPGFVHGGSGTRYLVGDFDGTTFVPDGSTPRWLDHGMDFYAPQTWSNLPDARRVAIAWMSNWRYALWIPTAPWKGGMTVPRELGLVDTAGGLRISQQPLSELAALRARTLVDLTDVDTSEAADALTGVSGRALEIRAVFDVSEATALTLGVRVGGTERTDVTWDGTLAELAIDRSASGAVDFESGFGARHPAPIDTVDGRLALHVIVDWSSVEVFAQRGTIALTDLVFPDHDSAGLSLEATGVVRVEELSVFALDSVWAPPR